MNETHYQDSMLKELWSYIKQHKKIYLLVSLGLIISYAMAILPTQAVQKVINLIAADQLTSQAIGQVVTLVLVSAIVAYIADYFWIKYLFSQSLSYRFELRRSLFAKVVTMRTPFFDKFRSGDMLTRFTTDTSDYSELVGFGIMSIFTALGTIVFIVPVMFLLSWQLSLLATFPIMIMGVVVYYISRGQEGASEEAREALSQLNNEVLEVVEGIRVTRAYGKKDQGFSRFSSKTKDLITKNNRIMTYQAAYGRLAYGFMGLSIALVIGAGGYAIEAGQLQLGDVIALQLYTLILMDVMWVLSDVMLVYQIGRVAYRKLVELQQASDDLEVDGHLELQSIEQLTFKDYHFHYANGDQAALEAISLVIGKGETLGIVGKTGSGKTSLVRQLLRQYPVGQGQLLLNNQPIQHYKRSSLEKKLGYVPQEHVLFSRSVHDNITLGKPKAKQVEVMSAIEAAAFDEDLKRMAEGLDTLIGEKGVSISGGQKQRLSIARALIMEPELLILDDSLSAVDAKTETRIIANIQKARAGKMTVIVTHRLSAVNHADWIIVMDEGKIIEAGRPESLLAKEGWYFEQHQRQQLEEGGES